MLPNAPESVQPAPRRDVPTTHGHLARPRFLLPALTALTALLLSACTLEERPAAGGSAEPDELTAAPEQAAGGGDAPARAAFPPSGSYVPPPGDGWESRDPAELGMDPELLAEAVEYALAHETTQIPEDPGVYLHRRFDTIPHQEIVGPTRPRGGVNGIVLKDGWIVAEFGDTRRVDMTFSVTKSYLSTVAGLAWDLGIIRALDDPVAEYVRDGTFDTPGAPGSAHSLPADRGSSTGSSRSATVATGPGSAASGANASITWHHLLQQTSEWEGTLWGKPDVADRRRGTDRELHEPGTFWEYNDVRVNLLAWSLLNVWRQPLPLALKEWVMDPIGASTTWRWFGYETSWAEISGLRMQSVSGGGHWGGGMFISTRDHARFGLLFLRNGLWGEERIVSSEWIGRATTPTDIAPDYGYMWWLNTDRELLPAAPESAFFALGAGSTNVIFVDPEHGIVTVTRWVDGGEHVNEFIRMVLEAVEDG